MPENWQMEGRAMNRKKIKWSPPEPLTADPVIVDLMVTLHDGRWET